MIEKEKIEKAANEGACLQRIQMFVWEYMGIPEGARDGVKMADDIFRDVEKVVMSDLRKEVEKKRLLENLPSEYEIQGFLGAHQKTAVIAFNKALDEVLLLMKR